MIISHTNALEKILVAQSEVARNAGHPNLRGGPREWFIREFLQNHFPTHLEIGQGEIIDEDSKPNPPQDEYRPQVDIVVYRRDMPRITYSRDNAAYLTEGVVATIESKSVITENELEKACKAAQYHKALKRTRPTLPSGPIPPPIQTYIIAYEGPEKIKTVAVWLSRIAADLGVPHEELIDLVVVLGKGVIWHHKSFRDLKQLTPPEDMWAFLQQEERNLFMFFVHMLTWITYLSGPPNTLNYVSKFVFEEYDTI
ncbi:MAG TPA: hypothetical protein PLI09_21755 [Candidatus Hydrogenedentes bacterium]|nr:hypothetical protein [Candidatus Hydrogenedentota bacterium]